MRRILAGIVIGIIIIFSYYVLLFIAHWLFGIELDLTTIFVATLVSAVIAIFVYKFGGLLYSKVGNSFYGQTSDYSLQLFEFTNKIHNIFSLKNQGSELLTLLIKAINLKEACLLFPEPGSDDFSAQFVEPKEIPLADLRLRAGNPIIRYLEREQKLLPRKNLTILPAFHGLWPQEKEEIESKEIAMFVPLISRDRLIAVLVLGKKQSGRYSLEDFNIIEEVTSRVAVSLEKEYLREQLREREEELSVINKSSAILSSSLDIQEIFGSFIEELKKVIDVHWASIVLIEESDLCCVALSSPEGAAYQVGEKIPMEGTGTGWVVTQKRTFIEPDLSQERDFQTGENFYKQGLRTMVYLPLIAKGRVIGSFIVASQQPNAYNHRHMKLLEQLASQIAMPLENTRLYAQAEQKARVDELTGLLNRRSFDEMISGEINRHLDFGGVLSIIMFDLDNFKAYNDTYGHTVGDELLKWIGTLINNGIKRTDRSFRFGGDEFAILLPQTTTEAAYEVAERIRRRIDLEQESRSVRITASLGIAGWPRDGKEPNEVIDAADAALYRAKQNGRNRSYLYKSE